MFFSWSDAIEAEVNVVLARAHPWFATTELLQKVRQLALILDVLLQFLAKPLPYTSDELVQGAGMDKFAVYLHLLQILEAALKL